MAHHVPSDARIFVAGHRGLVGAALVRRLQRDGYRDVLVVPRSALDLRDQAGVEAWFDAHRPDYVFLAAGTVGGIMANITRPAEFLYDNLMIHATVIQASYRVGVRRLLYLGSSCIYPRDVAQPITEEALLSGALEPTNAPYALAKIAGIRLCQSYRDQYGCDFISAMPTNIYGPGDNFDPVSGHVLPALIRRFHEARVHGEKTVTVWGTGTPRREFLHVDDLADCCLFLLRNFDDREHINVGTGADVTISELSELVRDIVHPEATVVYDGSKPDGMPRKVLDVRRLHALGWQATTPLAEGIAATYQWFIDHYDDARGVAPN